MASGVIPVREDFTFTLGQGCSWYGSNEHYCYHLASGITKIGGYVSFPTISSVGDVSIGKITKHIPKNTVIMPVLNSNTIAYVYITTAGDVKIRYISGPALSVASFEVTY